MKISELFDNRDKKERLSHIRNLIAIASADGSFDRSEIELITKIGIRVGLGRDEVKRIFERPDSIAICPPQTHQERVEQLYEMVLVMMIDGEVHDKEKSLCKLFASKLGFKPAVIDKIVFIIINSIIEGISPEATFTHLLKYA